MKKGFTLIEMLATIVIIGIIALVAIPVVTNAVEDAKIGVFKRNVENLEDIVNRKATIDLLKGDNSEKSYVYSDGKSTSGDLDKAFKGKKPDEAIIHVNEYGKIEYAIYDKDIGACASKLYNSNNYTFTKNVHDKNKCIGKLSINLLTEKQIIEIDGLKNYSNNIVSVDFVDYINVPAEVQTYDMSLDKNGSIIGWLEPTNDDSYKLYIGSEGKIYTSTKFSTIKQLKSVETVDFKNINTINATDMSYLFRECSKLNNIYNIQNLDTRNVTNMTFMFYHCSSLTKLDVSNFNTSKVTNMSYMFTECSSLTELDVSHFDTSKVTFMDGMFDSMKKVSRLDVSHFDTSKVYSMQLMFYRCSSLTELDLSNFNTSKVTDMSFMFTECSSLTELDLSHFDTSNVTDMRWMFQECRSLKTLNVSSFNTSKVTNMDNMFNLCTSLTAVDVSHFNTSKVTTMNWMFSGCNLIKTLDVSNFNTSKVTNMNSMFSCKALTELDLTSFDLSKVTNMNEIFSNTSNLNVVYVNDNWDTSNISNANNMFTGSKIDHVTVRSTN